MAYRVAWSHTDPELLSNEGVVDLLRNVVKGFSIIRAGTKGRHRPGFCNFIFFVNICAANFESLPAVESCGAAL